MQIKRLSISNLRNLNSVDLSFSPQLNIFYGDNAAGKSSILEAIYTLGNGRSFRTTKHHKVIQDSKESYTIFSQIDSSGVSHNLGLQRSRSGETSIKLNSTPVTKLSTLAKLCPVQILSPEQYDLLIKGPSYRRKQLDWGMFHVEHSILTILQKCHKILQHRNRLLKQRASYEEVSVWDAQLVDLSEQVTQLRQDYCDKISPLFSELVDSFIGKSDLSLELYPGWQIKNNLGLQELYKQQFERDQKLGFTQSSIQKADLKFFTEDNNKAGDYLSRGQQKLIITAFKLAQLKAMQKFGKQYPIFLMDDIGAELDQQHQQQLLQCLAEQPGEQQIFITCVHLEPLKSLISQFKNVKLFHVEHGDVREKG